MRLLTTLMLVVFVCAATDSAAWAQSDVQPITESKGLFTASFPTDWDVLQIPLDQMPETLLRESPGLDKLEALMIAKAPGDDPPAFVLVFVAGIPRPISPIDIWLGMRMGFQEKFPGLNVVKEGIGKAGEREVYYNYFTWDAEPDVSMYSVMIMFSEGTKVFLVMGSTANRPDRIEQYTPIFLHIAETLRPGR